MTKCKRCQVGEITTIPLEEGKVRVTCSNPACGLNEIQDRQGRKFLAEVQPLRRPLNG